jgi:hypothetical protein
MSGDHVGGMGVFMKAFREKATTLLATVVATWAISATAASQAGDPLTVAPTEGSQFTAVSVSGSNCRSGTPSVVGALTGPPGTGSEIEGHVFPDGGGGHRLHRDAGRHRQLDGDVHRPAIRCRRPVRGPGDLQG